MATNLEIINQALLELGASPITQEELDTPTRSTSTIVAAAFPLVLNEVLSDYDFPDLRAVVELASDTAPSVDTEFDFTFPLPTDFNTLRKLTTTKGYKYSVYRLEQTAILVNDSPIFLHYSMQITDASVLSDYLIPAIIYRLAARIAKPLTGNINERTMMNTEYEKAFKRAKRRASQDKAPLSFRSDSASAYVQAHQGFST